MDLEELKVRLDISTDDDSQDAKLSLFLEDAIDFVNRVCGQDFKALPPTAKSVVEKYIREEIAGNNGVVSESIGGMSQSFETKEQRDKALIDTLRKARLIRMRFTPLERKCLP